MSFLARLLRRLGYVRIANYGLVLTESGQVLRVADGAVVNAVPALPPQFRPPTPPQGFAPKPAIPAPLFGGDPTPLPSPKAPSPTAAVSLVAPADLFARNAQRPSRPAGEVKPSPPPRRIPPPPLPVAKRRVPPAPASRAVVDRSSERPSIRPSINDATLIDDDDATRVDMKLPERTTPKRRAVRASPPQTLDTKAPIESLADTMKTNKTLIDESAWRMTKPSEASRPTRSAPAKASLRAADRGAPRPRTLSQTRVRQASEDEPSREQSAKRELLPRLSRRLAERQKAG